MANINDRVTYCDSLIFAQLNITVIKMVCHRAMPRALYVGAVEVTDYNYNDVCG